MRSIRLQMYLPVLMACALAGVEFLASAQSLPPLSGKYANGTLPGGSLIPIYPFPVITGEPFRAKFNARWVQPLSSEQQATHEMHENVARDSNGRVFRETIESPLASVPGHEPQIKVNHGINVIDPVAGEGLFWSEFPPNTATRRKLSAGGLRERPINPCERRSEGGDSAIGDQPDQTVEELGERNIEGLSARGCRVTSVRMAGDGPNKGEPMTVVEEWWVSPELHVTLFFTRREPDGYDVTEQLEKIVLGEPNPKIFAPPHGYSIIDKNP
jgi:hypothetical protein